MKSKSKIVIVDADAIVAQANSKDTNHNKAKKIAKHLISSKAKVIYPLSAISEALTVIQGKMNSLATAQGTAQVFTNPDYEVAEVNQDIYDHAVTKYFTKVTNKKDTIFDCIVASVAEKYHADAIFSFDKFYKKHGFKLASEL